MSSIATYGAIIFGIILAGGGVYDAFYGDTSNRKRKNSMSVILLAALITAVIANIFNDKQHERDSGKIDALNVAVTKGNETQKQVSDAFISALQIARQEYSDKLDMLQDKISTLQTKADTAELRKQVTGLDAELEAARNKPKAHIIFSLPAPNGNPDYFLNNAAITSTTLHATNDVVHVPVVIINPTDVEGGLGYLALMICKDCSFASEIPEFGKVANALETQRNKDFTTLYAKSIVPTISLDVKIPATVNMFEVGLAYRCANCVNSGQAQKLIIYVTR